MAEQKEDAPSFRITYFGFPGRGAPLRAAAFLGGLSYEDKFTSFAEHQQAKQDGTRRWRGVPELTVFDKDGNEVVTFGQSNSCLRYIGKLTGAYPQKPVHRALVDEILDSIENAVSLLTSSFVESDAEKKKAMRLALMKPDKFPFWFSKFEQRLEENEKRGNKKGYFVGDSLTIADLKAYYMAKWFSSGVLDHIDGNALIEPNKRFTAFVKLIQENEAMQKYEAEFAEQVKQYKENKVSSFKKSGKGLYGSL
eukprot:197082_1